MKKTNIGRTKALISRKLHSVNTIDPNKIREGGLVYDKATGQWVYRDNTGILQYIPLAGSIIDPSGLEVVTETGNTGWRLVGKDPAYYANIGSEAIDFSYSSGVSSSFGATGDFAFASGEESIASGECSTAGGYRTIASGGYSFAYGDQPHANGEASTAIGFRTQASGDNSLAIGNQTLASGLHSFAGGDGSFDPITAGGDCSFAFQKSGGVATAVLADNAAVLGGEMHGIQTGADNSAILGGSTNKVNATALKTVILGGNNQTAVQPNMVYLPGTKHKGLTTVEIAALTLMEEGTMVWDTTTKEFNYYDGTAWIVSSKGKGLIYITEGGNSGWSMFNDPRTYKGTIGVGAKDFSGQAVISGTYGATGNSAVCFSSYGLASSNNAFVIGAFTIATASQSFAMGNNTKVDGDSSFAGGDGTSSSNRVLTSGDAAFTFQKVTSGEKGAKADHSAILGGLNNDIGTGAVRSVVLGGSSQAAVQPDMVYLPGTKYKSLTTIEIAALTLMEAGTFVYDSTIKALFFYNGTSWIQSTSPLTFNTTDGVYQFESDIADVKNQIGLEDWIRVKNNTGVQIDNGKVVYISGIDGEISEISLGDSTNPAIVHRTIGLVTSDIADGDEGFVTQRGYVRDFDTSGLTFFGPVYLGTSGNLTMTKPAFPGTPKIMGGLIKSDATTGIFNVGISDVQRRNITAKSYSFTSQGIGSGTYYKAGFYDFASADANLDQGNLTQTYGDAAVAYSAHVFIVCGGAGTVDTGVVGLKVSGTKIDDAGVLTPGYSETLIPDITAVALNEAFEGAKFVGTITYELFTVSGAPVNYSLDINYGYAKYEDFGNRDFYLAGAECLWQGGATDNTGFDIILYHHSVTGWTYHATTFIPGGTILAQRSVDEVGFLKVASSIDSAWKRTGLNNYINGSGAEGLIYQIDTGANNTMQTMDMHLGVAFD